MFAGKTEAVFAGLSPKQKAILGVPKPGKTSNISNMSLLMYFFKN